MCIQKACVFFPKVTCLTFFFKKATKAGLDQAISISTFLVADCRKLLMQEEAESVRDSAGSFCKRII